MKGLFTDVMCHDILNPEGIKNVTELELQSNLEVEGLKLVPNSALRIEDIIENPPEHRLEK